MTTPPEGTTPPEDKSLLNKEQQPPTKPDGAPEKYEEFKVPDGYALDEEVGKKATELFKGSGLSQAQAQSFVDFYVAQTQEAFQAPFKAYKDMREGWVAEAMAHPEVGGRMDQVKTTVSKAIDGLGDPKLANDFRAAMDLTGAGDHPAFIRVFYRLAQMVTEGKQVQAGGPVAQQQPGQSRSAAQVLYPNLP